MPDLTSLATSTTPWGAIAEGLGGLISLGVGIGQKSKGNKLLKNLKDESLPILTKQASVGLPSEQYNQAMKNIQRQQLMAMKGAYDRRSGLALLPTIQNVTNTATGNLDVANAQARMANEKTLASSLHDKYLRDYNYAMSLKGMGNQNLYGGLDRLAAGGISAAGSFGGRDKSNTMLPIDYDSFDSLRTNSDAYSYGHP